MDSDVAQEDGLMNKRRGKCSGPMVHGLVLDRDACGFQASRWAPGEARPPTWKGVMPAKEERIPIQAFRCENCGFVELYAETPAEENV